MTTEKCDGHLRHATQRAALDHLRWARRQSHGKNLRALNVFHCQECSGWHVGHSAKKMPSVPELKPTAEKKPRTLGEIRRKLRQLENQWDRQRKHRAYQLQAIVDADRAMWACEEELKQLQAAALRELGITLPPLNAQCCRPSA
jgi:hypothetical protein